ncbi:hypothetical protein CES86_3442 [Brucella lupini]|uniref:Uncharacterized protein n=1 Tax=Brucella lupini TaxID=255457 RepID=A0A256GJB9_9HYPH|nr:hypothetical protein CES86_3442 [Brucella lupini]
MRLCPSGLFIPAKLIAKSVPMMTDFRLIMTAIRIIGPASRFA